MNSFYLLLALLLLMMIPQITRRRRLAAIRHILNQKKRNKERSEMKELAKRFIGKECVIYTVTSNDGSVQGAIKEKKYRIGLSVLHDKGRRQRRASLYALKS